MPDAPANIDTQPAIGQPAPALPAAALPAAAQRALAEAEARRTAPGPVRPAEHGGRAGPEPVRYGDWEKNGLAIDF